MVMTASRWPPGPMVTLEIAMRFMPYAMVISTWAWGWLVLRSMCSPFHLTGFQDSEPILSMASDLRAWRSVGEFVLPAVFSEFVASAQVANGKEATGKGRGQTAARRDRAPPCLFHPLQVDGRRLWSRLVGEFRPAAIRRHDKPEARLGNRLFVPGLASQCHWPAVNGRQAGDEGEPRHGQRPRLGARASLPAVP